MPLRQCLSELFLNRNSTIAHRNSELQNTPGSSGGHIFQPPCSSRDTYIWLLRLMSRWLLSTTKDADPTTSAGNLWQCLTILTVQDFLCSTGIPCISICSHCLLSCHWAPLGTFQLNLIYTFPPSLQVGSFLPEPLSLRSLWSYLSGVQIQFGFVYLTVSL